MPARTTVTATLMGTPDPCSENHSRPSSNNPANPFPPGSGAPDSVLPGYLQVRQDRRGYRFSIDSILLAHSLIPRPGDTILDLGTGCGIIALILARRFAEIRLWGVEIQSRLATLARENVAVNGFVDRIQIRHGDLRRMTDVADFGPECGSVDWVVCNPPYRPRHGGRINPNRQKAIAIQEIEATLADIAAAAGRMLRPGGQLGLIYPAERMVDLMCALRANALEPKHVRWVHPHPGADAHRVLLCAAKQGGPGLKVAPPLDIYGRKGEYTPEVSKMFGP